MAVAVKIGTGVAEPPLVRQLITSCGMVIIGLAGVNTNVKLALLVPGVNVTTGSGPGPVWSTVKVQKSCDPIGARTPTEPAVGGGLKRASGSSIKPGKMTSWLR